MNHFILNSICLSLGFTGGIAFGLTAATSNKADNNYLSPTDYYLNETFNFTRAVDGDTLDISSGKSGTQNDIRVRLHGIDTPERGRFYFKQATSELEALCKGQKIRLDNIGDGKFDRISANVYCGEVFVNAALVKSGAAITSIKYANNPTLYKLQSAARRGCKGVWAKNIDTIYSAKNLTGRSPINGKVTLTNYPNCAKLTELTP